MRLDLAPTHRRSRRIEHVHSPARQPRLCLGTRSVGLIGIVIIIRPEQVPTAVD
jgi:hypothetical protein